jgi:F-type H+-transporting ATPase subunit delta
MRGASRATLAEAREQLAAIRLNAESAASLGDELFAVTGLLDGDPGLRRALSDPARPASAKTGLVRALLDGKVSDATLKLVTALAAGRWSAPGDLPDAAEQLAALATARGARSSRSLDDMEDALFRFGRVVAANPDLRAALANPFIAAQRKLDLLDGLLGGKVAAPAMRLINQAATHSRGRSLDASLQLYAKLAAEVRERLIAEVHVAVPLTDAQRDRLEAALAASYGHDVQLNVVLDPEVLGGMSVQIGDELIDGTTASRLAELRRRLAA